MNAIRDPLLLCSLSLIWLRNYAVLSFLFSVSPTVVKEGLPRYLAPP